MKIRKDFVTNSSSASYIICFARVADKDKAQVIIDKHNIDVFSNEEIAKKMCFGELGADWAGALIFGVDKVLDENPDSSFIVIEGCNEAGYDDDYEPVYDYNFYEDAAIEDITEGNGFADISVASGEGRDG